MGGGALFAGGPAPPPEPHTCTLDRPRYCGGRTSSPSMNIRWTCRCAGSRMTPREAVRRGTSGRPVALPMRLAARGW